VISAHYPISSLLNRLAFNPKHLPGAGGQRAVVAAFHEDALFIMPLPSTAGAMHLLIATRWKINANRTLHVTALLRTRLRMASSLKIRPPKFTLAARVRDHRFTRYHPY
jgi:hypothetical protein